MTARQPEALRLADELETAEAIWWVADEAAAELRRLYAENEDFRATCDHLTRENAEQIGEIVALKDWEYESRPLYTLPHPKRGPLTEDEIDQMWSDAHNDTSALSLVKVFARAIEAAHGIGVEA